MAVTVHGVNIGLLILAASCLVVLVLGVVSDARDFPCRK